MLDNLTMIHTVFHFFSPWEGLRVNNFDGRFHFTCSFVSLCFSFDFFSFYLYIFCQDNERASSVLVL